MGRRLHCCAGIRRRLAQVAAAAATNPAARSPASAPVSTSQKPKNPAAREIALPRVPGPFTGGSAALFCSADEFMTQLTSTLLESAAASHPPTYQHRLTRRGSGGGPSACRCLVVKRHSVQ